MGPRRPISSSMPEEIADRIFRVAALTGKPRARIVADLVMAHADEINRDLCRVRSANRPAPGPVRQIFARIPESVADEIDQVSQALSIAMGEIVADLVIAHVDEIDPDALEAGASQPRLTFDMPSPSEARSATQPHLEIVKGQRIA